MVSSARASRHTASAPVVRDPDSDQDSRSALPSGWRVQWLLWTLVAAIPTTQGWLRGLLTQGPVVPWWRLSLYHMPLWWIWLPLTPAIHGLSRKFPVTRRRGLFVLIIHLPVSLLLAAAHLALSLLWWQAVGPTGTATTQPFTESLVALLRSASLQMDLFAYWAVLAVVSAQDVYHQVLDREVKNSRLRYRLAQARIRALKTQLHPHFMFNALNAISTLVIRKDGATTERMLGQLAEFVRLTLSDSGQEIPLADDVALAEKYLSIEQVRFEDRLGFSVHMDPDATQALVPQLLLQPVVENAVRHGISPKAEGGHIEIRATHEGDRVCIKVSDDGAGLRDAGSSIGRRSDGGIGLSNTRDRLQHLYGDDFSFKLSGACGEGTQVLFDLPFRTASTADAAPESSSSNESPSNTGPPNNTASSNDTGSSNGTEQAPKMQAKRG